MSSKYATQATYSETAWRRFRPQTPLQWLSVWWPGAVNVGIVAIESTDHFSAANTRHRYYYWFCNHISYVSWETWGTINFELRKAGHFLGYGVICLIFYTCVARTLLRHVGESVNRLRRRRALGALLCTFLLASADEIHQTFIPSRTGAFHDVLLDVTGGLVMILFWFGLQTFFAPAEP